MRPRLPQPGRPVYEVQPDEETEREDGGQRLWRRCQTSDPRALPWGLLAEELAVQRLVTGTVNGRIVLYMLGKQTEYNLKGNKSETLVQYGAYYTL